MKSLVDALAHRNFNRSANIRQVARSLGLYPSPVSIGELISKLEDNSPIRNTVSTPWLILLCKYSDHPEEPRSPTFFEELFTRTGTGGIYDYWSDMTSGILNQNGSAVKGWFKLPYTLDQDISRTRPDRIRTAINAVKDANNIDLTPFQGIVVIVNAGPIGSGQIGNDFIGDQVYMLMVLDPGAWSNTFVAHEMGHCYGLSHSLGLDVPSCDPGDDNTPGAYCDSWDIMSAMLVKTFNSPKFGSSGPGLNAPNLIHQGWVDESRILNFAIGQGTVNVIPTLAPINNPGLKGDLAVRLVRPDGNSYYTIEYHRASLWDRGFPNDTVLIHLVKADGRSYLVEPGRANGWQAGDGFRSNDGTVSIKIDQIGQYGAEVAIRLS